MHRENCNMTEIEPMVFVVDDDHSVRQALERLVTSTGMNVETFAGAEQFLSRLPYERPCCLVSEVRLPGLSGFDLQETLASTGTAWSMIFIATQATVQMSVRAMKAGAVDFLEKPFDGPVLLDAIEQALEYDRKKRHETTQKSEIRQRFQGLTKREQEVLALVVTGRLNKQIALDLGISEKTVKVHRGRGMQKMKVKSLVDLVRMDVEVPFSSLEGGYKTKVPL
jgi:FixJ family two-component response regulator